MPATTFGLRLFAQGIFKARGYRWELRRSGEIQLGIWRKSFRKKAQRSAYPKRFVLIPGFGDSPTSWHWVLTLLEPLLKRNFDEILLFDFPGFSGSLSSERSFPTIDFMIAAVDDALDSLKPHTILGHSLGGWLTARYAGLCGAGTRPINNKLNYSGPDSILLVCPPGVFHHESARLRFDSVFRAALNQGFSVLRPHLFAKEPSWFRWLIPHYSQFILREDVSQFVRSQREDHAIHSFLEKIRSKVWILWGEKDSLIPATSAPFWLKHLNPENQQSHHLVVLRGVGHSPQVEKPTVTAAVIGQILKEKTPHRIGKTWWKVITKNEVSGL